jgi:RNA polymerase sigma-70 factor (ECF subfamily)
VSTDDHCLITECLAGNVAAFGGLVRLHQERLYRSVFRLVGNAEDAQDVVQEAFLSAYQKLGSFKGDALFFTWLYRIAVNTAITLKRKKRAVVRIDGNEGGIEPVDPAPSSRVGHALERNEEAGRVRRALDRLSPEHRAVLVMKDMEDMKYDEMAEALGVPVGTIRSRLHRARLELRQLLQQDET